MTNSVTLSIKDHIAEVTINRPEKMNALDWSVFDGLADMGTGLKSEKSLRAIVLSGAGGNFSSGIDLMAMSGILTKPEDFKKSVLKLDPGEIANRFQKPAYVWKEIEVPVIAALDGVVFGGGLQIALGADIRIASPTARLSVMEIKWGIIPDMALTTSLPDLVSLDVAKELVMTGRIFDGAEAARLGLVTSLSEQPLEAARELATLIATKSPDAVFRAKKLLDQAWGMNHADALRLEAELQSELLGSGNQREAVFANMQKRAPNFADRN